MSAAAELTWVAEDPAAEFGLIFGNASVGVAQCGPRGRVIALNPALEALLGAKGSADLYLPELIGTKGSAECDRLVGELWDGRRDSFHIEAAPSDSATTLWRWTVWRVVGVDGATGSVLALAEPSPNVAADTHRLIHTDRLETVGRLAGGVAHDFNNLLTGVLLYCDLLLATLDRENRARKYAEEIRAASLQATGLVRQLLALTKPTKGEPRLLSLNETVEGMRNLLTRLVGENIELQFHLDCRLGLTKMDPTHAQQVLLNLVLNSRDAMPEGGQIRVETSDCKVQMMHGAVAAGKRAVLPCALFTVEDNGCGMDASTQEHLFEPFFTTKAGKGTGLGLATVHDIVTRSGGLIHVDSEPGRGTRISVLLPLAAQSAEGDEPNKFHPANDREAFSSKQKESQS
jgi:signal transduction histidine kinase